ncbi:hypothetical protein ACI2KR_06630 [Pseudomonas luteola]
MPNPVIILDKSFSTQKEAETFFYNIRDQNVGSGSDISNSPEFEMFKDLYLKYCEYTNWAVPSEPIAFYARNIGRGVGSAGGTTQGFVVKFSDGSETEFSVRRAIREVAKKQSSSKTL